MDNSSDSNSNTISWRDRSANIRQNYHTEDTDDLLDQLNSLSFERDSSLFPISTSSASNHINLIDVVESSPPLPHLNDSSIDNEDINEDDEYSNLSILDNSSIPLHPSDIDPKDYSLPSDFDKQSIYQFLINEIRQVICSDCNKEICLFDSFYDPIKEIYFCIECTSKKNKEEILFFSWEEEEKKPVDGFFKCKRKAHFKPKWSFLKRDKQKGKDKKGKPVNINALKVVKNCFYCRNYKSMKYIINKKNEKKKKYRRYSSDSD